MAAVAFLFDCHKSIINWFIVSPQWELIAIIYFSLVSSLNRQSQCVPSPLISPKVALPLTQMLMVGQGVDGASVGFRH